MVSTVANIIGIVLLVESTGAVSLSWSRRYYRTYATKWNLCWFTREITDETNELQRSKNQTNERST